MAEDPGVDFSIGPILTAWLEVDADTEQGAMFELRLPFIPRVGEMICYGDYKNTKEIRKCAEITHVSWVCQEPDENNISRIMHVVLAATRLRDEDEETTIT